MKKITKGEKYLIVLVEPNYNTYQCQEHGIYQKRHDVDDRKCLYCKKEHDRMTNIKELKEKYLTELGLTL